MDSIEKYSSIMVCKTFYVFTLLICSKNDIFWDKKSKLCRYIKVTSMVTCSITSLSSWRFLCLKISLTSFNIIFCPHNINVWFVRSLSKCKEIILCNFILFKIKSYTTYYYNVDIHFYGKKYILGEMLGLNCWGLACSHNIDKKLFIFV